MESKSEFSQINILNRAMNLAYYELMGDANRVNSEIERYRATTAADIQRVAKENLLKEKSSTLVYLRNTNSK